LSPGSAAVSRRKRYQCRIRADGGNSPQLFDCFPEKSRSNFSIADREKAVPIFGALLENPSHRSNRQQSLRTKSPARTAELVISISTERVRILHAVYVG
jgi:hypothetical protein